MLHLQEIIGGPLNMLANLMSVRRPMKQSPEDQHVESALEDRYPLFRPSFDRSHSTLDLRLMVGIRPWRCQAGKVLL
jgi:hypothetical protein